MRSVSTRIRTRLHLASSGAAGGPVSTSSFPPSSHALHTSCAATPATATSELCYQHQRRKGTAKGAANGVDCNRRTFSSTRPFDSLVARATALNHGLYYHGSDFCFGRSFSTAATGDNGDGPSSTKSSSTKEQRLEELESKYSGGPRTTEEYNEAIAGYAEIGEPAKAEEFLSKMEQLAKQSNSSDGSSIDDKSSIAMPDIDSYTAVIDSYLVYQAELDAQEKGAELRSGMLRAAESVDGILKRMERSSASSSDDIHVPTKIAPSSHHYDAAVTAWSRCVSRGPIWALRGIPQRAQAVLERMETLSLDRSSGVRPTVETYNRVIEAWSNSTNEYGFAPLAQAVYERMGHGPAAHLGIQPNDRTIRTMIRCWTRSDLKNAAFHATGHLMRLQELTEEGAEDMSPTLDDYLKVFKCWSKSDDKHAARRAQTVLKQMERLYHKRISDCRPTISCYRYVLIAMSNSKLLGQGPNADELMARMEDRLMVADSGCFGATIKIWSNSACHKETEDAAADADRADEALQQMKDMYQRSSQIVVKASTSNYNDVLRAYAACQRDDAAGWRAEELLDEMNKLASEGDSDVAPDAMSYVFTMNALAQSTLPDKVAKSMKLLKAIAEDDINTSQGKTLAAKPTVDCFHAMIKVCSSVKKVSADEKNLALRTAIKTVKMLKDCKSEECKPNAETYKLLIDACGKLIPKGLEQQKALETIFNNCCRDGLVDDRVLRQFKKTAPFDLYQSTILLNAQSSTDGDGIILPEEWTRNIGHRVRTAEGRRPQPLSPDVGFVMTKSMADYKMRRLRSKKNQRLLRGGRL